MAPSPLRELYAVLCVVMGWSPIVPHKRIRMVKLDTPYIINDGSLPIKALWYVELTS